MAQQKDITITDKEGSQRYVATVKLSCLPRRQKVKRLLGSIKQIYVFDSVAHPAPVLADTASAPIVKRPSSLIRRLFFLGCLPLPLILSLSLGVRKPSQKVQPESRPSATWTEACR